MDISYICVSTPPPISGALCSAKTVTFFGRRPTVHTALCREITNSMAVLQMSTRSDSL